MCCVRPLIVLTLDPRSGSSEQEACKWRGRELLIQTLLKLFAPRRNDGDEVDESDVAPLYSMKTGLISDFAPYGGLPGSDGGSRLTERLVNELRDDGLVLRGETHEALVVILIQSGVRQAPTGEDVVFYAKTAKPSFLFLRTLLHSLTAAVVTILVPPRDDAINSRTNLKFLCVIDPTLSDLLLPVPNPAIASQIQSVLNTLPTQFGHLDISYSICLPTCSAELRERNRKLLESAGDPQGDALTDNPFSPKFLTFLEVLALNLQCTFACPTGMRAGQVTSMSTELVRTTNQFLVLMWAHSRRTLTTVTADPMELSFLMAGRSGRFREATKDGVQEDDIFGFDSLTLRWLRLGYALFPPAEATLHGFFLVNNSTLSAIWGELNNERSTTTPTSAATSVGAASTAPLRAAGKSAKPLHPSAASFVSHSSSAPGIATGGAGVAPTQRVRTAKTTFAPSKPPAPIVGEEIDFTDPLYGVIYIGQHPSPITDGSGQRHCLTCCKELTAQESWADHVAMPSHLEKAGEYKSVNPEVPRRKVRQAHYLCTICHTVISGDQNRSLHVEGFRHKRRKELMKLCPTCNYIYCSQDENFAHKEYICGQRSNHTGGAANSDRTTSLRCVVGPDNGTNIH